MFCKPGFFLFHLSGNESLAIPLRFISACELYGEADFYTTHPRLAQCRNDPTVTLFSQNENTLFSLLLSDEGNNILYQTKDRK